MKRIVIVIAAIAAMAVTSNVYAQRGTANTGMNLEGVIADLPLQDLSDAEIEGLLLMREEEKLARDVYLELADEWNIRSFSNIAQSEDTHMTAVALLLDKYDITDPVRDDSRGVFENEILAGLYEDLVASGKESYLNALKVGAKIEELDIADLIDLMASTDNTDIQIVYQNLLKGSRNHLRSFDMQVQRFGGSYEPEHLSSAEYERIASSPKETGAEIADPNFVF